MNYMPIVPIGLLNTLDLMNVKNVFMLTNLWKYDKYKKFYLSHHWDTVILDNDLYEQPVPANFVNMMDIARQLDADRIFVVGPEKLNDGVETGRMTVGILADHESEGYLDDNIQLMCILHERPNEMMRQWNMIKRYEDVALGISIFSYRLGYDRGALYKFLNLPGERYTHAFGWDNLLEVYNMRGLFNSVDSSMAVSAAVNGVDLHKNWQITRDPIKDGRIVKERLSIEWDERPSNTLSHKVCMNIKDLTEFCAMEGPVYKESELP
jgi:hypothetical protein